MALKAVKPITRLPVGVAQARNHKFFIAPAPVAGLSVSEPLVNMDPQSAIVLDNVFLRRSGVELRGGYQRWVTNLGGAATPSGVVSVMSYNPPRGAGGVLLPQLFAACENENIYDVTNRQNEAFAPVPVATLAGQVEPGELSWTNFANESANYLLVCSAGAGYWTYDGVGGWVDRTANITGDGAAFAINFDFVMVWKNRIWFLANNSSKAFYLPVGAIQGAATEFDFGPLLVHGGDLKAMASWTFDGGDGIDDRLIIVGQGGDVLIYQGTDPSSASTFGLIGRWFTGRPPAGRRFLSKDGGDLAMVTEQGIEYMSHMVQGHSLLDPDDSKMAKDPARRFNEVIGGQVRATRGQNFWTLISLPSEESSILVTPYNNGTASIQYAFGSLTRGWSRMTNMPMACAEEFEGDMYFGTTDGKVCKAFAGTSDDELSNGTPGQDLEADILSAFIAPEGDGMSLKRPLLICPMFQAPSAPQLIARINTEWRTTGTAGSPAFTPSDDSLWDSALWDQAVWSGSADTYMSWQGADGLGAFFALRMSFRGLPGTVFTSWKCVYEPGGIM